MSTTPERAPWTGSTVEYDAAVEAFARAQIATQGLVPRSEEQRKALQALRAARERASEAAEEMIAWSTSRAYRHILQEADHD